MKHINKLFLAATLLCLKALAAETAGTPIQGTPIGLEGDPGSIKVSTKADANGSFSFNGLPPGKYKLCIADQPCKSLVVGNEKAVKGQVLKSDNKVDVKVLK